MELSVLQVRRFLAEVDDTFPVPLSRKQDLDKYAQKLVDYATLCVVAENGRILSMVAGYTDRTPDHRAYAAIAATVPDARGRGLAEAMMRQFIAAAREKGLEAVHLYAVAENQTAIKIYRKLGFRDWQMPGEPRPEDVHLKLDLKEV